MLGLEKNNALGKVTQCINLYQRGIYWDRFNMQLPVTCMPTNIFCMNCICKDYASALFGKYDAVHYFFNHFTFNLTEI